MITIICHNQVAKMGSTLLDIERLLLSKCKENGPQLKPPPPFLHATYHHRNNHFKNWATLKDNSYHCQSYILSQFHCLQKPSLKPH